MTDHHDLTTRVFSEIKQVSLQSVMEDIHSGHIQLPSFHRAWQWDLDRIVDLLDFIGERYPIGAVAAFDADIPVPWGRRLLDGVPSDACKRDDERFILIDGQQRLTAVYQACFATTPVKLKLEYGERFVRLFFDMAAAVAPDARIKDAIVVVSTDADGAPLDGAKAAYFDPDFRYENGIFPATSMFDFDAYEEGHRRFWAKRDQNERRYEADQDRRAFRSSVVLSFLSCSITLQVMKGVRNARSIVGLYEALNMHASAERVRKRNDAIGF